LRKKPLFRRLTRQCEGGRVFHSGFRRCYGGPPGIAVARTFDYLTYAPVWTGVCAASE